jgi:hypoxanthine phosphoribosyltransferase
MGLCIGLFGLERTLIVNYPDVKLPTDIAGIMTFRVRERDVKTPEGKKLVPPDAKNVVRDIEHYISKSWNNGFLDIIRWEEYGRLINKFLKKINLTDHAGSSCNFDAILSASRSGTMAAELVSRTFGFSMPVHYIVKGRGDNYGFYDSDDVVDRNMDTVNQFNRKGYANVLLIDGLVDDKLRITMGNALSFLKQNCPNTKFKTGALIADKKFEPSRGKKRYGEKDQSIDFVAEYREHADYITWFYKYF